MTNLIDQTKSSIDKFLSSNPQGVVVIRGATATGKSSLSLALSDFFSCEIISADSRQIFRGMNIGTDKVSLEIRQKITHHQIDIVDPDEHYTASQRQRDTYSIIDQLLERKKIPLIVGGTGLYIDTIYKNFSMPEIPPQRDLRGKYQQLEDQQPGILRQKLYKIDPQEAQKHHPNSTRYIIRALEIFDYTKKKKSELIQQLPVRHPLLMIGLRREKEDTNRRINNRIDHMIAQGLKQEVEQLINQGFHRTTQSLQTIGYKETIDYIDGIITKNERTERIKINTHQFAKRQRTRFKRYIHDANNNPKHNVTYNNFLLSDDQ